MVMTHVDLIEKLLKCVAYGMGLPLDGYRVRVLTLRSRYTPDGRNYKKIEMQQTHQDS